MNSKPSKSAKKREAQNVQSLGERLLELSEEQLAGMPLDDELRSIVVTTRNINSRSALRRQRLYLAKVLRATDNSALQAAIAALEQDQSQLRRVFHQAERWRDRIMRDGTPAIAEFAELVDGDTAEIEQLVGELHPNLSQGLQRKLSRDIFRKVHEKLSATIQNDRN